MIYKSEMEEKTGEKKRKLNVKVPENTEIPKYEEQREWRDTAGRHTLNVETGGET